MSLRRTLQGSYQFSKKVFLSACHKISSAIHLALTTVYRSLFSRSSQHKSSKAQSKKYDTQEGSSNQIFYSQTPSRISIHIPPIKSFVLQPWPLRQLSALSVTRPKLEQGSNRPFSSFLMLKILALSQLQRVFSQFFINHLIPRQPLIANVPAGDYDYQGYWVVDKTRLDNLKHRNSYELEKRVHICSQKAHIAYQLMQAQHNTEQSSWREGIEKFVNDSFAKGFREHEIRQEILERQTNPQITPLRLKKLLPLFPKKHYPWIALQEQFLKAQGRDFFLPRMDITATVSTVDDSIDIDLFAAGTDKTLPAHIFLDFESEAPAAQTYPCYEHSFINYLHQILSLHMTSKIKAVNLTFSGHSLGASLCQHLVSSLLLPLHSHFVENSAHAELFSPSRYPYFALVKNVDINLANAPGISQQRAYKANEALQEIKKCPHSPQFRMQVCHTHHDPIQCAAGQEILFRLSDPSLVDIVLAKVFLSQSDVASASGLSTWLEDPTTVLKKVAQAHSAKISEFWGQDNPYPYEIYHNKSPIDRSPLILTLGRKYDLPSYLPSVRRSP